jgi:uncharacterized membrane protein
LFFAILGIILSIILYEIKNSKNPPLSENVFLAYSVICTFFLAVSIYMRYDIELKWKISRGLLT